MIVYLDTNVYKSAKYKFDSGNMNALKNLVNAGKVSVLFTSATAGEVIQHIEEDISNAVKKYNHILNKEMPALNNEETYSLHELDINDAVENVKQKLNEFLELEGVNKIPLNPLDAEKLFEDYFSGIAPFEKKKPYEFKDAIMINAIKNYKKSVNEPICVVSGDEGFRKSFDGDDGFIVFDYLGYFLKYYNLEETNEIMKCTIKEVENGEFDDVIKDYLDNLPINIDCYVQWECEDKEINNICSELLYIEESEGKKYAIISSDVIISIDVTYLDETMSYYDKEEGRYLIENYIHAKETHKVNIELRWECVIKDSTVDKIPKQKITIDDNVMEIIELSENTMIDKHILDLTLNEEENLEHCSQCGKPLAHSDYKDYENRPMCRDCMKGDNEGEICPICGRKIPHQYMMSGFCQECAQKNN